MQMGWTPVASIATVARRLGNGFAEGVQGRTRSAAFLSQDRAGSSVRYGGGRSASTRYGLSVWFRLFAARSGYESMDDSILARDAGVASRLAGEPGQVLSSFTPERANSRRKSSTHGWYGGLEPHGAVSRAACEHHGGRTSSVSNQHVAATVPCDSHSHKAVDLFHFRLVTLASKWVEQSWRAEWLMEIWPRGSPCSPGANMKNLASRAGRKEVWGPSVCLRLSRTRRCVRPWRQSGAGM